MTPAEPPGRVPFPAWPVRLETPPLGDPAPGLGAIAARLQESLSVDVVAVQLSDDLASGGVVVGYAVGPSPTAQALTPLLAGEGPSPLAIADAARESGRIVEWSRLVTESAQITRLAAIADAGGPAGALHRLMIDAGGVAVPLVSPDGAGVGAVALVCLGRDAQSLVGVAERVRRDAPQIALSAHGLRLEARAARARETLDGIVASTHLGILVTDLSGRMTLANAAAARILGTDLQARLGRRIEEIVEEVRWRFRNPREVAARLIAARADPEAEWSDDLDTVDGRAIEHASSPVRGASGRLLGRVDILTDVTLTRQALADARRLAAERAELLEREERRAQEEVALTRAGHRMASALTAADIRTRLMDESLRLIPGLASAAVLQVDPDGSTRVEAALGMADTAARGLALAVGRAAMADALTTGRPFVCNDATADPRVRAPAAIGALRAFLHLPLVSDGRAFGVLVLACERARALGERELRVASELARHGTRALRNAHRFEHERHIAETLQRALLAGALPEVPGLQLAALYQAAAGSDVGGDLYSAWVLDDGRLALLVGDVSGKGVEAAGVTAMVRHMAAALSRHTRDPADLMGELNELLRPRLPDGALVAVVLALIDPRDGEVRWSAAGHPAPLVRTSEGASERLEDADPPCGVFAGHIFTARHTRIPPGGSLVLYTDGIIEARRDGRELGEEGLDAELLLAPSGHPGDIAHAVLGAARRWADGHLDDDIAVAVVRRPLPTEGKAPRGPAAVPA